MSFKDDDGGESSKQYYLPSVEIKYYNVMIDGRNFFDQQIKYNLKIYDNIRKIATGQSGDNTTGCFLDYSYFIKCFKLIVMDLSKQLKLYADPNAIQQINFTRNLDRAKGVTMFLNIKEAKETVLNFSKGTVEVA